MRKALDVLLGALFLAGLIWVNDIRLPVLQAGFYDYQYYLVVNDTDNFKSDRHLRGSHYTGLSSATADARTYLGSDGKTKILGSGTFTVPSGLVEISTGTDNYSLYVDSISGQVAINTNSPTSGMELTISGDIDCTTLTCVTGTATEIFTSSVTTTDLNVTNLSITNLTCVTGTAEDLYVTNFDISGMSLTYGIEASTGVFDDVTIANSLTVDTDLLYVDNNNNQIGIGTTSPATNSSLHINAGYLAIGSTNNATSALTLNGSGNDCAIYMQNTTSGGSQIYSEDSTGYLKIRSWDSGGFDSTDDLIISTGGFVGTGTSLMKWKIFSGTTDADSNTTFATGLVITKILGATTIINRASDSVALGGVVGDSNLNSNATADSYRWYIDASGNFQLDSVGANLQSAAYRVCIFYIE